MRQIHEPHEMRIRVLMVLGMHRSGTSAFAGSFGLLGCGLPQNQIPSSPDNPAGFFESRPVAYFNDDLLTSAGLTWSDWQPIPEGWASSETAMVFQDPAKALLQDEFGAAPLIVLKDPRICRLFPFWRAVLQNSRIDILVVVPFRHPIEVAQSLHARNGMPLAQGLLLWVGHVMQAEYDSRGCRRSFNRFHDLIMDPVETLQRVQDRLGLRFPHSPASKNQDLRAFLSPKRRHHKTEDISALPAPINAVYDILLRWAEDGEDAADHAALDRLRTSLQATLSAAGDSESTLSVLGSGSTSAHGVIQPPQGD